MHITSSINKHKHKQAQYRHTHKDFFPPCPNIIGKYINLYPLVKLTCVTALAIWTGQLKFLGLLNILTALDKVMKPQTIRSKLCLTSRQRSEWLTQNAICWITSTSFCAHVNTKCVEHIQLWDINVKVSSAVIRINLYNGFQRSGCCASSRGLLGVFITVWF